MKRSRASRSNRARRRSTAATGTPRRSIDARAPAKPPVRRPARADPRSGGRPSVRSARGRSRLGRPPANRLVALLAVLVLAFTGILLRLVVLQVKDASALEDLALDQRVAHVSLPALRGTIFDRGGHELAMSLPAKSVFADPHLVKHAHDEAISVAGILSLPLTAVEADLTRTDAKGKPARFVYVARGVDLGVADRLAALHLPGIGFLDESKRYYPSGTVASQVLGFVGADGTGLAGLEYQYQKLLGGRPGSEIVQEDPNGTLIPQAGTQGTQPVPGDDVVLTIDSVIQYRAQAVLAEAVKANRGKGGTILVMDPKSGEILAMASYPWFDPNHYQDAPADTWRNRAVTDPYEPGSVNKVITASAAIEENLFPLDRQFVVPYAMQVSDHLFHDAEPHATRNMTLADILAYSSNIGTIKVASMLHLDGFASYLYKFGFGAATGVGFPGDSAGILPDPTDWYGTSMATIPIGQGVSVTPLQMADVYSTIANGGVWVQPTLVRGTVDAQGAFHAAPAPKTHRVISEETAATVAKLMAFAVDVGTGTEAQIPGYWVAGKTGTAQIPNPNGGYYLHRNIASFIGFAPAADPAVVIAVVIDEPKTVFGGVASAPAFSELGKFVLARLRVPPAPQLPIPPHAIPVG